MRDEEAAAVAARAEAATPGPWECWDKRGRPFYDKHPSLGGRIVGHSGEDDFGLLISGRNHSMNTVADATFIAHARDDIPALLAERAALVEIVRAVAALKDEFYGKTIDGVKIGGWAFATEDVTPLVEQARALLGE